MVIEDTDIVVMPQEEFVCHRLHPIRGEADR